METTTLQAHLTVQVILADDATARGLAYGLLRSTSMTIADLRSAFAMLGDAEDDYGSMRALVREDAVLATAVALALFADMTPQIMLDQAGMAARRHYLVEAAEDCRGQAGSYY
jgi:hypothetical protein